MKLQNKTRSSKGVRASEGKWSAVCEASLAHDTQNCRTLAISQKGNWSAIDGLDCFCQIHQPSVQPCPLLFFCVSKRARLLCLLQGGMGDAKCFCSCTERCEVPCLLGCSFSISFCSFVLGNLSLSRFFPKPSLTRTAWFFFVCVCGCVCL